MVTEGMDGWESKGAKVCLFSILENRSVWKWHQTIWVSRRRPGQDPAGRRAASSPTGLDRRKDRLAPRLQQEVGEGAHGGRRLVCRREDEGIPTSAFAFAFLGELRGKAIL